jgi:tetratricopeptide (TPR) repeat protein
MEKTRFRLVAAIMITAVGLAGLIVPVYGFRGECKKVVCFDGSVHECGFDCSVLVRNKPGGGGSRGGTYIPSIPPVPSGPTPQQLEKEREERVEDLNERGLDAYERRDFAAAARYFREALEYNPHDPTLKQNLGKAEQKARQAEEEGRRRAEAQRKAFEEAAAAAAHAQRAASIVSVNPDKASQELQRVFDTKGDRATVSQPASPAVVGGQSLGHPARIPPALTRHPEVQKMQKERADLVDQVKALETRVDSIRQKKNQGEGNKGELEVQEAKTKQEISNLTSKILVVDVKMEDFVINLTKENTASEIAAGKGK